MVKDLNIIVITYLYRCGPGNPHHRCHVIHTNSSEVDVHHELLCTESSIFCSRRHLSTTLILPLLDLSRTQSLFRLRNLTLYLFKPFRLTMPAQIFIFPTYLSTVRLTHYLRITFSGVYGRAVPDEKYGRHCERHDGGSHCL